mgnify:CR=1 FL=1
MGYPDDFIFYPNECKCSTIQCLAQGVPVNFIKYISKEISDLSDYEKIKDNLVEEFLKLKDEYNIDNNLINNNWLTTSDKVVNVKSAINTLEG